MKEKLFESGTIGSLSLKNKIIMAPMGNLSDSDGGFSERQIAYYEERAKGGVGLIVSGSVAFSRKLGNPYTGILDNFRHVGRLQHLTDAIHRYGTKFAIQLNMGGGRCGGNISASQIPTLNDPDVLCHALTREEIHDVVTQMGKSAKLAQSAEVDAVLIHAYAGYLLDQFQSSEWNHREDEYGGCLENRMRLTTELIQAVKQSCGSRFPVIVKFSVSHGTETGRKLEEGLQMCKIIEKAGADAIVVDTGSFETQWNRCIPTVYEPDAYSLYAAKRVKETVSIPIIGQNKLSRPELAEQALADGSCDFVALGHGLLADPQWANKVAEGREDEIRACIGCNNCLLSVNTAKYFRCSVNPWLMHEQDVNYQIKRTEEPQRVLVVGGGPGGMMAATTAAQAGHHVELWERNTYLGGNALAASIPMKKTDVKRYLEYLEIMCAKTGVKVTLSKDLENDPGQAQGFDAVILATGAESKTLPILGSNLPNVISALDYLHGRKKAGKRVVVLGGGLVGCETACKAAEEAEQVTILEFLPNILMTATEARNNSLAIRQQLQKHGVDIICDARATEITPRSICYNKSDKSLEILCDTVIMATGFNSNSSLKAELEKIGVKVTSVGDAVRPRNIRMAVNEGLFAALDLD